MSGLFQQLKQRKVVQVAAAYAITAWLIVQIVVSVEVPLGLPDWVDTLVIVLLGIGFPISLILSWAFDLTPGGVKSAGEATAATAAAPTAPLSLSLQLLILLAVGFLVVDQYILTGNEVATDARQGSAVSPAIVRFGDSIDRILSLRGRSSLSLAPDGSSYAFVGNDGLYIRQMNELNPRLVVGTDQSINHPVISPTGEEVIYWNSATQELRRVAIRGGAPVTVAADVADHYGVSWSSDGRIFYAQRDGIYVVPESGSIPRARVVDSPAGLIPSGPVLLPDNETLLYSLSRSADWDSGQVLARSLSTGEDKVILNGGMAAKYMAPGYLVYALGANLFGIRFDLDTLGVNGQPELLVAGVDRSYRPWQSGNATYDVSASGSLVYSQAVQRERQQVVSVSRNGVETPLAIEPREYSHPSISPNGEELLLNESDPDNSVWVWNFQRQTQTRLALGEMGGDFPVWSADGSRIAYHPSTGTVIDWHAANNTGIPETLFQGSDEDFDPFHPEDFSNDGNYLVMTTRAPATELDLAVIDLNAREIRWRVSDSGNQIDPDISPSGRWLAYTSTESGRGEIYVRSFPDLTAERYVVSGSGGNGAHWSDDGSALYYVQPGDPAKLMSVRVAEEGGELSISDATQVLDWPYRDRRGFDVAHDEQSFIALKSLQDGVPALAEPFEVVVSLIVVQNWIDEVRARIP